MLIWTDATVDTQKNTAHNAAFRSTGPHSSLLGAIARPSYDTMQ
jgi:hypothetical protein